MAVMVPPFPGAANSALGHRQSLGTENASEDPALLLPRLGLVAGLVGGQGGHEGFLGDLDAADRLHPLLAFLLLLQQLALAGDVAAVALGEDVLADGADRLARDDPRADGGLDGHL